MLCLRQACKSTFRQYFRRKANVLQGHISRDCTAPNGGPLNTSGKVCYKCGQAGHISRDCTANETTDTAEVAPAAELLPTAQAPAAAPVAAPVTAPSA